jgi:predicted NUDIX family NTP pyrophosphohydrolase
MIKKIFLSLFFVFCANIDLVFAQEVVSVNPVQNALNISKETNISVTFNQDMNDSTINDSTFIVHSFQTGLHTGTYSYDTGTKTASFNPDNNFTVGEIVYVILTTGIEDTTGDTLTGPYEWSFTIEVDGGSGEFAAKVDYGAVDFPNSVFSSDLDSDGDMDLAVANANSDNVSVLLNNGDGTFAAKVDYGAGDYPYSVFSSDLDSDGDMDLAVANGYSDNVSVLLNNGDGTFAAKVDYGAGDYPFSVFSSDLDSDGDMDLAVANNYSGNVSILLNNGDGTFAAKVDYGAGSYPHSVFSSDLDSDGDMDLAVANIVSGNVSVLLNNGDGTFSAKVDYGAGNAPNSVFSSDLDGDGDMDLAVANFSSDDVSVLLNNGNGTFAAKAGYGAGDFPLSLFSSDLDSDGDMDLTVANAVSDNISVLLNNGDGTFAAKVDYGAGDEPRSIFSSDLDSDGDMDLAVANGSSDNVSVLLNNDLFITVTSPNGGEEWKVDSIYNITWASSNTSGNVNIAYSTDNGSNWIEIADSTEDDSTYSWIIPDTPSDSCLVRITDTDGSPSDTSDAVFRISPVPFITVTSPNGGEDWQVGSNHDITWVSAGTSGAVNIEYSTNNGSDWTEIIASMPDSGIYPWTIPDTPSDSCLVRISDTAGTLSDTSDGVFTISSIPFVTLTSPNGGEQWRADSTCDITWLSTGTSGAVNIEYSTNNGSDWTGIIASMPDSGIYPWIIPDTPSDSCLVRITDTDGSPSDTSDAVFAILPVSAVPEPELPKVYSMSVKGIATNNRLEVRYGVPEKAKVRFWVYDIKGTKVEEFSEESPAGFYSVRINMSGKPAGVYFLKMEANGRKFLKTSKFVLM